MHNEDGERVLRVSEIFYSIEGEGPLAGMPTVFVRFFGCNFTCQGFSNPDAIPIVLSGTDDLSKFKPSMGCDSVYAWHPDYKDTTKVYTVPELADAILAVIPDTLCKFQGVARAPILSFTGGEPTLHQSGIADLLDLTKMNIFSKILIETNASLVLKTGFLDALKCWTMRFDDNILIWACSPKLKNSGELHDRAIRPSVVKAQKEIPSMQYFKFVSDGSVESFEEIVEVFSEYNASLIVNGSTSIDATSIYVMPVGATLEQQVEIHRKVADMCLRYGFNFCARVHCYVYKNQVGT